MTMLSVKPGELARQRKLTSDSIEPLMTSLGRTSVHKLSSHGQAAHDVREYNDKHEIEVLSDKEQADKLYYENLLNELTGV